MMSSPASEVATAKARASTCSNTATPRRTGIAGALVLFYLVLEGAGWGNSSEYRSCSEEKITRATQLGTEEGRAIQACYLRDPFNFAYSSW